MGNKLYSLAYKKLKMTEPSSVVLVILGSTGTGKSKLAVELAMKFNGEIISADSMQVYKGLDIVTNKVTLEEQKAAVHHMIDYIDPLSRFTVVDFQKQALPIIEKILKKKKLPIIVGGTNYYIESLMWNVLIRPEIEKILKKKKLPIIVGGTNYYIESLIWNVLIRPGISNDKLLFDSDSEIESESYTAKNKIFEGDIKNFHAQDLLKQKITQNSLNNVPNILLHKALQQIDPAMADMLHPKDRRKVIRSLQVYQQHGICHSELLKEQRNQNGGSSLGGPLRYKNSVMLWLQCNKDVLGQRLDDRVDDMVHKGLVNELLEFHKMYNEKRIQEKTQPYEEGIFQSIGFKEFHEYLILSDEEKNSERGKKILSKAIKDMKLVTRQYARKQRKWVENRFLRRPKRQVPPIYGLDATNVDKWEENVLQPAVSIIQSLLEKRTPPISPLPIENELSDVLETHYCEICDRIFVGKRVWEIHLASKRHSKRKASLKKQENNLHVKSTA